MAGEADHAGTEGLATAAACHEGYRSCFFRQVEGDGLKVVAERIFDPKQVYKK